MIPLAPGGLADTGLVIGGVALILIALAIAIPMLRRGR